MWEMHQQASNWVSAGYVEVGVVGVAEEVEEEGQDVRVDDVLDVQLLELDLLVQDHDRRVVLEPAHPGLRVRRRDPCADVLQLHLRELRLALLLQHLDHAHHALRVLRPAQVVPHRCLCRLRRCQDLRLRASDRDEVVPGAVAPTSPVCGCLRGTRRGCASARQARLRRFLWRASNKYCRNPRQ